MFSLFLGLKWQLDQFDCEHFGETIWDQCWWINNVKWVTAASLLTIWFGPVVWAIRKAEYDSRFRWNLIGLGWLFVGGLVAIVVSMKVIEPILLWLLGAS